MTEKQICDDSEALKKIGSVGGQVTSIKKQIRRVEKQINDIDSIVRDDAHNMSVSEEGDVLPVNNPLTPDELAELEAQKEDLEREVDRLRYKI